MRWNLRMVAAERGIWKSTELRRRLADAGLEISTGKMSGLWTRNTDHDPARRPRRHLRRAPLLTNGAADLRTGEGHRGTPEVGRSLISGSRAGCGSPART